MSAAGELSGLAAEALGARPTTAKVGVATQPTRGSRWLNPPGFNRTIG